jgi:hypothetical protein
MIITLVFWCILCVEKFTCCSSTLNFKEKWDQFLEYMLSMLCCMYQELQNEFHRCCTHIQDSQPWHWKSWLVKFISNHWCMLTNSITEFSKRVKTLKTTQNGESWMGEKQQESISAWLTSHLDIDCQQRINNLWYVIRRAVLTVLWRLLLPMNMLSINWSFACKHLQCIRVSTTANAKWKS